MSTEASMVLVGGLINLLSNGKTQYTVVEGGEQAELLEEINLTLKNIDVKLERVDAGLKEHRQRDLEQKLRCH